MLLRWHVLSSCLFIMWLCPANTTCPPDCHCRTDDRGKRRVSCNKGGMIDPIPTFNMDPATEVIDISAPDNDWNIFTVGSIFQDFKSVEEIHITRSNVVQIGMHAFWGVPSLRLLNLTHNNLTVVFDHNFRGLVNLVQLNLDNNNINRLPSGAFKHLTELRILTVQRNYISELVPKVFLRLSKLQVLKLSSNPLNELNPDVFKDIPELRVLECRNCQLRRINPQVYHLLPYLAHLDLGDNQMQFLNADEFIDLRRLKSLYLDGNLLPVVLERTFINQVHLRTLCLARNRLAKITDTALLNLSNLIELDISYNKLSKFESMILNPVINSLQKLSISGNRFPYSIVKLIVQAVPKTRDLQIADLKLNDIPIGFLPPSVIRLNVSGNNLTNLSTQALPHQLLLLDLSRNQFRGLSERLLLKLEKIKNVHLHSNLWTCDVCHVAHIINWLNKTNSTQDLFCASPSKLKGHKLNTLTFEQLPSCDKTNGELNFMTKIKNNIGLVIGGITLGIFLIACIIFVVCSCMRRHRNARMVHKDKRRSGAEIVEEATAMFGSKGEISFKFPLDLTERQVSVSTIDNMKKETQLHTLPNGTGI